MIPRLRNTYFFNTLPYYLLLKYAAFCGDYFASLGGIREVLKRRKGYPTNPVSPENQMPINGQRLDQVADIALPAANSTDTLVLTYRVPQGYDGVILSLVNYWTGTGFVDGSGDLIWRIQVNENWLKNFGNIRYTLGSLQNRYPLEGAYYRIKAGDLIRYYVRHRTGSVLSGGNIITGIGGYIYPNN